MTTPPPADTDAEAPRVSSSVCIVTGLSGAGKSTALGVFEDLGYFTVDGLPAGCYDGKDEPYFYTDRDIIAGVQNALPHPLRTVTAASGDIFVADNALKNRLRDTFFGDICEMEIAGICLAAERNHIPVFSMKVISDGADEKATESFGEVLEKGLSKYEHLLPVVLDVLADEANRAKPPVKV